MSKIIVDRNICFGKPVIEGTRVPIDLILSKLAAGMTYEEIMDEYAIRKSDILAVLSYAVKKFEDLHEYEEMTEKGLAERTGPIEKQDRLTLEGLLKGVTKQNIHREVDTRKLKERRRGVRLPKSSDQIIDPRGKAGRIVLARMILKLFDLWGLNTRDRAALLGLSESSGTSFVRYRKGSCPLPNRCDLLDRVANILSIHRSLRVLFPKNRALVYRWPTTPNRAFNGQTPVEVIRRERFSGLLIVRHYLDSERER